MRQSKTREKEMREKETREREREGERLDEIEGEIR